METNPRKKKTVTFKRERNRWQTCGVSVGSWGSSDGLRTSVTAFAQYVVEVGVFCTQSCEQYPTATPASWIAIKCHSTRIYDRRGKFGVPIDNLLPTTIYSNHCSIVLCCLALQVFPTVRSCASSTGSSCLNCPIGQLNNRNKNNNTAAPSAPWRILIKWFGWFLAFEFV